MFEPFFDQYLPSVTFNGGVPVYVPLHPDMTKPKITSDDWKIDFDELRFVTPSPPDALRAIYLCGEQAGCHTPNENDYH